MSKLRINNATVFVTVLSACLGLMAAGASAHAHQTASSVLSDITSATSANLSYRRVSNQAPTLPAAYHSPALPFASGSESCLPETLYRNSNPLNSGSRILVVTRLARASLDAAPVGVEAGAV